MGLKFLDLFAGIGGFRLGMEAAGHECVGYVEWDKYARKSYEAIHNTEGEWTAHDITKVSTDELRELRGRVDVICGGFPCQAFSIAGKRGGFQDTRGTMFFEIARFAQEIQPRTLLLENVKGLLSHDEGRTFETILRTLDEMGYDAEWCVLNSKDFGVPQNRERVFIIGHLRGSSRSEIFPIGGQNENALKCVGLLDMKGNECIRRVYSTDGIAPTLTTMEGGNREPKVMVVGNTNPSGNGMNGNVFDANGLAPTLTTNKGEGNKILIEYDRKNGIGKELENAHTLNSSDWRGLNRNQKQNAVIIQKPRGNNSGGVHEIAPTVTSRSYECNNHLVDGLAVRKLTPRECWRLQSFPDLAFDKAAEVNSDTQLYKQAGNSVTVNVIKAIAERL
jgi:DNA (cytosine-5)-methyltransferase 1